MIALCQFGNSACCEKQLMWPAVEFNRFRNEQFAPTFLTLNPAGAIPALVNDREVVSASTLICE